MFINPVRKYPHTQAVSLSLDTKYGKGAPRDKHLRPHHFLSTPTHGMH